MLQSFVPWKSALKEFIKARHAAELPDHRRIDSRKAQVVASNRGGNVALSLHVINGDDEYGARKLIGTP